MNKDYYKLFSDIKNFNLVEEIPNLYSTKLYTTPASSLKENEVVFNFKYEEIKNEEYKKRNRRDI